ncbi:MAG: tRNA lysidine(34) synthetase TilS [Burkholderiaceae bacterium]
MAASPTPRPRPAEPGLAPLPHGEPSGAPAAGADALELALNAWAPSLPLAVACSGGADSMALLHACAARWPGQVMAIHVHHGLQAAADDFARHVQAACSALGVRLECVHVDARHASGESPEDAARRARYLGLADAAQRIGAREVLLAQHADDQAETLLIALSRGAGLPGLAAMPARFERNGVAFGRPLLGVRSAALRAWLAARRIGWIDDPTNADAAYTRNRIRAQVLPALQAALPGFVAMASRSAGHAAQAQGLLDELAQLDLQACGQPPAIAALQALSAARQANAIRAWLRDAHGTVPSTAQMDELLAQVAACRTRGHRIEIKAGSGSVQRAGERLQFCPGSR